MVCLTNRTGRLTCTASCHSHGRWLTYRCSGRGVFEDTTGEVHDGEWANGVADGPGVLTSINGSTSEGTWKDGLLDGHAYVVTRNEDGTEWLEECVPYQACLSHLPLQACLSHH